MAEVRVPLSLRVSQQGVELVRAYAAAEDVPVSVAWRKVIGAGMAALGLVETVSLAQEIREREPVEQLVPLEVFRQTPQQARKALDLQARIDQMQTVKTADPLTVEFPEAGNTERDFYSKPLLPGYERIPDTWWAQRPGRPNMWIGEKDADGNPMIDGGM